MAILAYDGESFGAHPLITDDSGTVGESRAQIELNSEFTWDQETKSGLTHEETGIEAAVIITYGLSDRADLVLGVPYQWIKIEEDDVTVSDESGLSDLSLELKWRFFKRDGIEFALKPGITLPAGDEDKGLGTGKASYGITFIVTKELEHWAFHLNFGYTYHGYKLQEDKDANRKNIWHISAASDTEVFENLTAVVNAGIERNSDITSDTHPAFLLVGIIYSVSDMFAFNMGVKAGLNQPESDFTGLLGSVFTF